MPREMQLNTKFLETHLHMCLRGSTRFRVMPDESRVVYPVASDMEHADSGRCSICP